MRFLSKYLGYLFVIIALFSFFPQTKVLAQDASVENDPFNVTIPGIIQERQDRKALQEQNGGKVIISDDPVEGRSQDLTTLHMIERLWFIPGLNVEEKTVGGNIFRIMAGLYANPPAHTAWWVQDTLASAGFVKPAYAQGFGFAALSPFLVAWKGVRNLAYLILIIVMIAIGFMIIFRMKIDPKTVISLQAALPKIVVTIILITFSYPIVGFLVDLMYLVMALIISFMANTLGGPFTDQAGNLQAEFMTGGLGVLFKWIFLTTGGSALKIGKQVIGDIAIGSGVLALITQLIPRFAALSSSIIIGAVPTLLFAFILVLGIVFTFIRVLLLMLNAYIQILINLILGPLLLLVEAVPGKSGFGRWISNILANLAVFPTVVAVLMFASYLIHLDQQNGIWAPPLLGGGPNIYMGFMGMALVFILPTLIAQVKKVFNPKPALPISAGTAFAPLTGGAQTVLGMGSQFYYLQQMPFINKMFGNKGNPGHHP